MRSLPRLTILLWSLAFLLAAEATKITIAQGTLADYHRADQLPQRLRGTVTRERIEPHWLPRGDAFWYPMDAGAGRQEWWLVNAVVGTRRTILEKDFYKLAPVEAPRPELAQPRRRRIGRNAVSPDGKFTASVRDNNVYITSQMTGEESPLTSDGTAADGYTGRLYWSPDSRKLVAIRRVAGQTHPVHLVESSPRDRLQPKLHTFDYLKPGDVIPLEKPHVFNIEARTEIPIDEALFPNPWSLSNLRWEPSSERFTFLYNQRGHRVMRVIAVDAATGAATAIVNEQPATFFDYAGKQFLHYLNASHELIWMSERDGWNHLYLYDTQTGDVKQQITSGNWPVLGVERVDEQQRQVWFRAGGIHPDQDPYHVHYARINFDGTGLTLLTQGNGTHELTFSPDRRFYLDRYSRVDLPPVTELRRTRDGGLILELERADWTKLLATGWQAPERFVAIGRDGETNIYGVIFRPTTFAADKSYPVIEKIYAGPQGAFVPKRFSVWHGEAQALAELGFIVVQIDGMGTNWRSKAFHDVCWKNLADSGFPDRILWLKAAAATHPEMDLTRVGIFGGSAGGQSALRAVLAHGDFYKVAAADCGCHDNRMDKIWWNELWMSWPVGPWYAEQSNVTNAHRLSGKLLLIVGELDRNVDPASTMQVVDALVRADKDFELLIIPGAGHGAAGTPYGTRRQRDFFVRHLLKVEPRAVTP